MTDVEPDEDWEAVETEPASPYNLWPNPGVQRSPQSILSETRSTRTQTTNKQSPSYTPSSGSETQYPRPKAFPQVKSKEVADWEHLHLKSKEKVDLEQLKIDFEKRREEFMGVPQRLFTDLGKEFCSAFQDGAELDETLVEPSALEMPTQRAITERAGKTFKEILEKAMDNYATQSESEWRDLVDIVNMTVNRLTNKSGYSPCQRLLGYTPKMPGGLQFLTEEEKKERQWANRGDLQMQRAQTMRLAAAKAFHEIECQQAMKNAIHHGRRSIKDFEVGQTVYFWRRAPGDKASKESTRHIVKAAPEQLRHASMEEHQSLSSWMEGLSHLRQIIEEEPKAGYIDLTKEYKEEDFEDEEEDIPLESRDSRKEKPKYKIEGKTERKDVVMREEEDEWLWNEAKQTLTRFHLQYRQHLFKPTDVSDCPVDYNKLGPQRRTTMYFEDGSSKEIVDDWHEEAQPVHKRWKGRTEFQMMIEKFAWEKGEPEAEETTRMTSPTVSLSGTTTEEAKIGLKRGAGEDEENNEGLEKRARTETVEDQKKEEEPIRGLSRPFEIDGEDQEQIPKRQRIDWFEVMINTVMPVMKKPKGQNEIKLKQLLDEAKTKYYKAIKKEIDNNIKTGAYEILSPEASEEVRRAGHNILQSRYVLVEKRIEEDEVPAMQEEGILLRTDEHGGFKAKARHVMKGFSEPDSEWLEAEAMEEVETGIVLRPIPMKDIRIGSASDARLKMSLQNWQKQISRTPYMTATDSRSLFDNLTRSTNVAAHIEDKRTAIDLAILKNDMNTTRGQTRSYWAERFFGWIKAGPEAAAWSAARRDTALQVCRTILERGGILVERGHEAVLKQTLQDGSSVICTRCGALVAWSRAEAHRAIWCSSLGDQVAETDAAPGDASNDDMDIDYGAPTGR
ncbi:unnamed protein product [Durusdinium trenchii]|uniref:Integrase catalytic domain-containing protein n=1 Tax=Durusdinium trenchii TaxID=1381693 RepID=A0ABP0SZG5_9DINO